jgi:Rieske Fe-S protein
MSGTRPENQAEPPTRRSFFQQGAALVIGAMVSVVPFLAGLAVLFDPLRRKSGGAAGFVSVASLDSLPVDGAPRKFTVVAERTDAWNRYPKAPVGAVYLRRTGERSVQALQVVCPHAGCFVEFLTDRGSFLCPCHNSTFAVDGAIKDAKSPSPRPLDSLEVEVRNGNEIWVKFQHFRTATSRKIPVA